MTETGQGPGLLARLVGLRDGRRRRDDAALALYGAVVAAARDPRAYARWSVPDTAEGRFEMIGVHAALVNRHLRLLGGEGVALSQALLDLMLADFDRSLREMGVGDLSVGKHVKAMAASLRARAEAIDAAIPPVTGAPADPARLVELLRAKVYDPASPPTSAQAAALAQTLLARDEQLAGVEPQRLLTGDLPLLAGPESD